MAESLEQDLLRSRLFSEELGIELAGGEPELFKWFLASLLSGARISGTIARNTYRAFERHGLLTPRAILSAGWDYLVVPVMREGGYVRYDGRKSTQILRDCEKLLAEYETLTRLHAQAAGPRDLERRLLDFYGVGPVTVNIFLRELRPIWPKADPEPLPRVKALAAQLGIELAGRPRKSLAFVRLEAGLVRARAPRRARREARGAEQARPEAR